MFQLLGTPIRREVAFLAAIEAAALYAAIFILATLVVHSPTGPAGLTNAATLPAILIFVGMLALGVYEPDARADLPTMTERLSVACLLGASVGFGIVYVFGDFWVSPLYALACAALSYGAVASSRFAFSRIMGADTVQRRTLVVGHVDAAARLGKITYGVGSDADIVGSITAEQAALPGSLLERALDMDVGEIVVSERRREILPVAGLLDCKAKGIRILDAMDFVEAETGQVDIDNLYPARFIFSQNGGYGRWATRAKRTLDVAISATALLLLSPLLLIVGLLICFDSPGGAFYRQTRCGLNNRPYEIIKFRSMRSDAEAAGTPQWAQANDSRVTRIGRMLRQTRIDELPQLWNILKGEMSLVGPRPERPYFVEQLEGKLPFYAERHRVKPGLTGWAQIKYRYGASEEDAGEKLRFDLYYVKNFNVFLDISILARTVRVVLWPDGVH